MQEKLAALPTAEAITALERQVADLRKQAEAATEALHAARTAKATAETALKAARENLEAIRQRLAQAERAFHERLAEQGVSAEDYSALKPLFDTLRQERQAVEDFFTELKLTAARHEEARKDLADRAMPDLAALKRAASKAEAAHSEAARHHASLKARLEALRNLLKELTGQQQQAADLEQRAGPVLRLAEELSGKNALKLDLETFAIGAMFDRVLQAANQRLGPMTHGRFRLLRRVEGRGAALRGLDIEVFDAHTGRARPVHTLSGGETFMAALALALGLADVVESASGKVRLDTIFIDEGFGALDADEGGGTLDQVLRALEDLAGSSRVVGVISHVGRVKEAIPAGFEVVPSPAGSTIRPRGAPGV